MWDTLSLAARLGFAAMPHAQFQLSFHFPHCCVNFATRRDSSQPLVSLLYHSGSAILTLFSALSRDLQQEEASHFCPSLSFFDFLTTYVGIKGQREALLLNVTSKICSLKERFETMG